MPFYSYCLDYVVVTNDSDEYETKVLNRLPVLTHLASWRYRQNTGPSVHQLCTLLNVVSAHPSSYNKDQTQCFWFARTVFTSIGRIFPNAAWSTEGQIVKERQADFNIGHVLDAVCTKYDEVYTAELPLETKKEKNKMKELLGNAKSGRLKGWKRSKYGRKK